MASQAAADYFDFLGRHVPSPLSLFFVKVLETNNLCLDLPCKVLILLGSGCKVFHAWDLAASGADKDSLDFVLPPALHYTWRVKGLGANFVLVWREDKRRSFDCGTHGVAVSAFAQDDNIVGGEE
jgi:hypothetical protein